MKIIRCRNSEDIDVEFLDEHHYVKHNTTYSNFVRGQIKNPYDKTLYGIAYIGHGKYKPSINKQNTPAYNQWVSMLERCYCERRRHRTKAYVKCEVCDEWLNFQNFAKWHREHYYDVDERLHLDKDILIAGNLIYAPDRCLLVPQRINELFTCKVNGYSLPVGIKETSKGRYEVKYNGKHLGTFDTLEQAFEKYAQRKEEVIREVADEYVNTIPKYVYDALMKYKVEMKNDKNIAA